MEETGLTADWLELRANSFHAWQAGLSFCTCTRISHYMFGNQESSNWGGGGGGGISMLPTGNENTLSWHFRPSPSLFESRKL